MIKPHKTRHPYTAVHDLVPAYWVELLDQCLSAHNHESPGNDAGQISEYYSFSASSGGTGVWVQFGLLGIVTGVL